MADDGIGAGGIAGIVLGVLLGVLVVAFAYYVRRVRRAAAAEREVKRRAGVVAAEWGSSRDATRSKVASGRSEAVAAARAPPQARASGVETRNPLEAAASTGVTAPPLPPPPPPSVPAAVPSPSPPVVVAVEAGAPPPPPPPPPRLPTLPSAHPGPQRLPPAASGRTALAAALAAAQAADPRYVHGSIDVAMTHGDDFDVWDGRDVAAASEYGNPVAAVEEEEEGSGAGTAAVDVNVDSVPLPLSAEPSARELPVGLFRGPSLWGAGYAAGASSAALQSQPRQGQPSLPPAAAVAPVPGSAFGRPVSAISPSSGGITAPLPLALPPARRIASTPAPLPPSSSGSASSGGDNERAAFPPSAAAGGRHRPAGGPSTEGLTPAQMTAGQFWAARAAAAGASGMVVEGAY